MKKYKNLVCGGTFDLLHKGHKKFLLSALEISESVLVGVTSNSYTSKYKILGIEDFEIRKNAVLEYLKSIDALDKFEIISIDSRFEPLLENKYSPQAILVTPQTHTTAIEINKKRKEVGLDSLEIEVVEMEKAQDDILISSTRIRNGEIDRDGCLYFQKKWENKLLILPEKLRGELQRPFGKILDFAPNDLDGKKIITIGDVTTKKFNENKIGQFISIIDFKIQRIDEFDNISDLGFDKKIEVIKVNNIAGTINPELFIAIGNAFKLENRILIQVDGEEDLAVLPVLLIAPLGFIVYYGQPNHGLVEVKVTEENKKKAYDLVSKFTS